jgi:YggT family protein
MRAFFNFLSGLTTIYTLAISVRIILTWFRGGAYSRPIEILGRITDPYLNWFRRFPGLRAGFLDLSPIVALGVLSVINGIFATLAFYGAITLGIILAMLLQALWAAIRFFLFFFIAVLVLRLIAYLSNRNIYSPFWHIVDSISQPVLFRISRIFFGRRVIYYRNSLVFSIVLLGAILIVLWFLFPIASALLMALPV